MKAFGGINKITPLQLLHEGKVWLTTWENTSKEAATLLPATYCLFTALELYMKAYLALKNSNYADTAKLKKLGHNFRRIYQELLAAGKSDLLTDIHRQIKKYNLEDIALDGLKYPDNGRVWALDQGLEKGHHTLDDIFERIEEEITKNNDPWLETTYPKQSNVSAMIQIGYEGDPEAIDLESLSNTCSKCLPSNLIISENYQYPWHRELIPHRICKLCQNSFNPNGMRNLI